VAGPIPVPNWISTSSAATGVVDRTQGELGVGLGGEAAAAHGQGDRVDAVADRGEHGALRLLRSGPRPSTSEAAFSYCFGDEWFAAVDG
jgi:hypothetical protein